MINSVCLVGYLGMDPEIRSTPGGIKIAKLRLAVKEYRTNRQTNEKIIKTHWFTLNAWDRQADNCEKMLHKGSRIAVRGTLEYQEWERKEGGKGSKIEIRIREMEILTPLSESRDSSYSRAATAETDASQPNVSSASHHPADDDYSGGDFAPMGDDDIPF